MLALSELFILKRLNYEDIKQMLEGSLRLRGVLKERQLGRGARSSRLGLRLPRTGCGCSPLVWGKEV